MLHDQGDRYCAGVFHYERFLTREVKVGDLGIGGSNRIRVQSMTTTDTMNTAATVAQSIRMIEAGCELVRITAPSLKEAQNLENIKKELRARGYQTPLVADIHFTPNAAELAARIVEKVRVNPGNYADKKKFEHIEYTDSAYEAELERIRERFTPLVKICREYGTAMRIGTNHGSLSDRIMSRYGDSPLGMVESALEFLRIAEDNNFYNIVLSMKSSNTQVMVQAYRLLVARMIELGMNYPLHLGVTEAGEGEDGRIKSAVGIGTLLEDGLGDTIRVSLTEDPEFEIPVAQALAARYHNRQTAPPLYDPLPEYTLHPFDYQRRASIQAGIIGGEQVPRVIADLSRVKIESQAAFFRVGYSYSVPLDKWNIADTACDFIFTGSQLPNFEIPGTLGIIIDAAFWKAGQERVYPLYRKQDLPEKQNIPDGLCFVALDTTEADTMFFNLLAAKPNLIPVVSSRRENAVQDIRVFFLNVLNRKIQNPVILRRTYNSPDEAAFQLYAATDLGALLIDGLGDGIWLGSEDAAVADKLVNQTAFGILQAARVRISKTEYISCPSCGRTLFDLQETTASIRKRTSHLKGVKIGIMGCIVNGPGEMADADFGYVGTGPGKITLYKGREVVKRNVDAELAVDELVQLIRDHGRWVDAES
jgi:(E)-4-hydroxy-3-methylbut-2-enyl-diphosphate synthase